MSLDTTDQQIPEFDQIRIQTLRETSMKDKLQQIQEAVIQTIQFYRDHPQDNTMLDIAGDFLRGLEEIANNPEPSVDQSAVLATDAKPTPV